jgi:beta-phosphoglucomutase family hydrolase
VIAATPHLRLPTAVRACLFDLDGVLTDTAALHAVAWKQMFDDFLRTRPEPFVAFDVRRDYASFVDGKERNDGVRSFLRSRNIQLSEADVHALGDRKNELVLRLMHERGVESFPDALEFVQAVRRAHLATAVVSSSTNCREVLDAAHIAHLFDVRVDGRVAAASGLAGKPAPDMFVAAARMLGVEPAAAAVFEDALPGVEAGRAGAFALVVGIARAVPADALRAHGADVVVHTLTELLER